MNYIKQHKDTVIDYFISFRTCYTSFSTNMNNNLILIQMVTLKTINAYILKVDKKFKL